MVVRQLLVQFGVGVSGVASLATFNARMDAAKGSMESAADTASGATYWLKSLVHWFARAAVAAGGMATAFAANAVLVANNARNIERGAQTLGLTTQAYQELTGVLAQFGVDAPHVAQVFQHLSAQMEKGRAGGLDSAKSFALIGIHVNELKGLSVEQTFYRIAEGMQATKSASARLAAANQLLSEETARRFLPALMNGGKGLDEMRRKFVALGGVMDSRTLAAGKRLTDNLTDLKIAVQGVRQRVAMALIPILEQVTSTVLSWYDAHQELINSKILEWSGKLEDAWRKIKDRVVEADVYVRTRLNGWGPTIRYTTELVLGLVAAFYGFKIAGGYLSAILSTLNAIAAILDIGVLGALVIVGGALITIVGTVTFLATVWGTVYLVLEDIYYWLTGKGKSAIGAYINEWLNGVGVYHEIARALEAVRRIAVATGRILYDLGSLFGGFIVAALESVGINLDNVRWLFNEITTSVWGLFDALGAIQWAWIATQLEKLATALERSAKGWDAATASTNPLGMISQGVTKTWNMLPNASDAIGASIDLSSVHRQFSPDRHDPLPTTYAPVTTYNVTAQDPEGVRAEIAKHEAEKLRAARKAGGGGER